MCCNWLKKMFGGKCCCQHGQENAQSVNSTPNAAANQEVKSASQPESSEKNQ